MFDLERLNVKAVGSNHHVLVKESIKLINLFVALVGQPRLQEKCREWTNQPGPVQPRHIRH